MGLLDFIKNRQGQSQATEQQSQQQRPETAKEMYTRQAAQERASQKPEPQIADAEKSKAKELGGRIDIVAQGTQQIAPAQTPAPQGGASSPEPQRQMMTGQDKVAPPLSPTSAQLGKAAKEQDAPAPSQDAAAKSQERSQEQARRTIARTTPSWDR